MPVRSALITVMARAAEKAARGLKRDFGEVEHLQVSRKGPADFVSTADLNAQKILRDELARARPEFDFLMEEGEQKQTGKDNRWIIDPLDGTTNFLHAVPHWCISIAAECRGEVIAGIVFEPLRDEMFWAEKGTGAYNNHQRLRVSSRSDLSESLIATGFPFKGSKKDPASFMKEVERIMPQVAGIRRAGSAALDLAYVAAGRYDGYWETGINLWDVAAGALLVTEAGGFISPIKKGENPLISGALVASNDPLHDRLVAMVRGT
ncbi:MAG: inositol monophosphatase [Alphaproteobacteria bacterium]|nr:inositol monophosphatase [Alphaproteobacteria bacterium]